MPRLIHAVLCQQVITDTETGAVSYINILEEIVLSSSSLPLSLPPIGLGCLWMKVGDEPDAINVRVRVTSPDGVLGIFTVDPIPMAGRRHRHNLNLMGVVARREGDILFHVEVPGPGGEWVSLTVLPFTIYLQAESE